MSKVSDFAFFIFIATLPSKKELKGPVVLFLLSSCITFFSGSRGGIVNSILFTNEECAKAIDMGNFYRVPADNRDLNYDKYFKEGDEKRNTFTEFNSNNTRLLNIEETKAKIASLKYIQERLNEDK
jgi:hypothetical protein